MSKSKSNWKKPSVIKSRTSKFFSKHGAQDGNSNNLNHPRLFGVPKGNSQHQKWVPNIAKPHKQGTGCGLVMGNRLYLRSLHISLVTFYCSQPGHSDWTWRQILDHEVLDKWLEREWERAFIGGGEFSDVVHVPLTWGKASARSKPSMNACAHPCELIRLPISKTTHERMQNYLNVRPANTCLPTSKLSD